MWEATGTAGKLRVLQRGGESILKLAATEEEGGAEKGLWGLERGGESMLSEPRLWLEGEHAQFSLRWGLLGFVV